MAPHVEAARHEGRRAYDAEKPTVIICAHELSGTGAPAVALDLVTEAAERYNVALLALRPGALVEDFRNHCCLAVIGLQKHTEIASALGRFLPRSTFGILNSVESFPFVGLFVAWRKPFLTYVHEYPNYVHPYRKDILITRFSDRIVYSSETVRDAWRGSLFEAGLDVARDTAVLPQRPVTVQDVSAPAYREARARLSSMIGADCGDRRIVYGAGSAQWRKGTDYFVQAAARARRLGSDTLFVWVGNGIRQDDMSFGVWIEKDLDAAGANLPDGNLFTLPSGDHYLSVADAADALFLSSRLDPLPNVVFDALAHGCHVAVFEGATGFADEAYQDHPRLHAAPYGDVAAAVALLDSLPRKVLAEDGAAPAAAPSFELFASLQNLLPAQTDPEPPEDAPSGDYDVSLLFSGTPKLAGHRAAERAALFAKGRLGIWENRGAAEAALAASDHPAHRATRILPFDDAPPASPPPFQIHLHAHYVRELSDELGARAAYAAATRVVVTTDHDAKAEVVQRAAGRFGVTVEVMVLPNIGRDAVPFLRAVDAFAGEDDEVWVHVHQKKSVGTAGAGDVWRAFLQTIVLGGEALSPAAAHMADPGVGLVGAFDPYLVGWSGSRRHIPRFAPRLSHGLPARPLVFPVGNMFWTRAGIVRAMAALFGPHYPWPNEPIAADGTPLHFMERMWPTVVAEAGLTALFLDKPDQPRG